MGIEESMPHAKPGDRDKVRELISTIRVGLLTTFDRDGHFHTRPVQTLHVEADGITNIAHHSNNGYPWAVRAAEIDPDQAADRIVSAPIALRDALADHGHLCRWALVGVGEDAATE